jgi:hypothetical protein
LEEFTALRKDIASQLRGQGQEAAAADIAKLKKPTISAWVVNQLVRTKTLDVARLLKAGEALDRAQEKLLAGKTSNFDAARAEEAAAVRLLQDAAREVLPTASAQVLERVTQTLRSATSAENRTLLKSGRLTEDLEPPGFDAFSFVAPEHPRGKGPKVASPSKRLDELNAQRKAASEVASRLTTEALDLELAAKEAELAARRARQRAEAARAKADAATDSLGRISAEIEAAKKNR